MNRWMGIGAASGLVAVMMGAFGAHALSSSLSTKSLSIYQTAAQYQMYHALALIGLGLWSAQHPETSISLTGWTFVFGTLIFSGSLYTLAITEIRALGAITPIGGLLFMLGWGTFAYQAWRK